MNSSPKQEKTSSFCEAKKRLDQARELVRRNEELRREIEMNMRKLEELFEEGHRIEERYHQERINQAQNQPTPTTKEKA